CPCSPLLFALYIDRLLRQLEKNPAIMPVSRHGWDTNILAYVDDDTVVTANPDEALLEIEKVAYNSGRVSGYLLNKDKTQVVVNEHVKKRFSRVGHAVYLGTDIRSNVEQIVQTNLTPIKKTKLK
ncbi:hypothetical protein NDU88_005056, partial [Pleurodeles waltl]